MFDSGKVSDELKALKADVSRLLSTTGEEIFDTSGSRAEGIADQIKAALNELGGTLNDEDELLGRLIAERPVTSLAAAFALGVLVGFMLRRN